MEKSIISAVSCSFKMNLQGDKKMPDPERNILPDASEQMMRCHWPGNFKAGQAVIHKEQDAHVVALTEESVPEGKVPILYDVADRQYTAVDPETLQTRYIYLEGKLPVTT
ncbi:hypothetical protein ACFL14_00515 [Patescibacteria group bacterium]